MLTKYDTITQHRLDGKRPCEIVTITGYNLNTVKYWLRRGKENGLVFSHLPHTARNYGITTAPKKNQVYFKKTMETVNKIHEVSRSDRGAVECQKQNPANWETQKPDKSKGLFTTSSLDYIFKR